MKICPPSVRSAYIRSASWELSTESDQIRAAHGLKTIRRHVGRRDLGATDGYPRVQHGVLPFRADLALIRCLAVLHHHRDRSAEMTLVEPERVRAVAAVVQVGVQSHLTPPLSIAWPGRSSRSAIPPFAAVRSVTDTSNEPGRNRHCASVSPAS